MNVEIAALDNEVRKDLYVYHFLIYWEVCKV